ncbi:MAG: hypothetical protein AUJ55_03880 [Proteobacteria bacterium CG1_02_64_396]|nr:MAG: hypothetical protein AUJ55_03880 [Proteobacteria bacterium CG1_02_64_396]
MAGIKTISVNDLNAMMSSDQPPLLIDVRTPAEYNAGHAPKAVLIPLSEVERAIPRIQKLAGERPIALICRSGNRSGQAAVILSGAKLTNEIVNVGGGTMAWQSAGYAVER